MLFNLLNSERDPPPGISNALIHTLGPPAPSEPGFDLDFSQANRLFNSHILALWFFSIGSSLAFRWDGAPGSYNLVVGSLGIAHRLFGYLADFPSSFWSIGSWAHPIWDFRFFRLWFGIFDTFGFRCSGLDLFFPCCGFRDSFDFWSRFWRFEVVFKAIALHIRFFGLRSSRLGKRSFRLGSNWSAFRGSSCGRPGNCIFRKQASVLHSGRFYKHSSYYRLEG